MDVEGVIGSQRGCPLYLFSFADNSIKGKVKNLMAKLTSDNIKSFKTPIN